MFDSIHRKKIADSFINDPAVGITNIMAVPYIRSVHLNMGLSLLGDSKKAGVAKEQMKLVSGLTPAETLHRKSNASFSTRQGALAGYKVTLRKRKMYCFLWKLVFVVLTSMRDFKGFRTSNFDGLGNLNFGIDDLSFFPEISVDYVYTLGMNVTVVTTACNDGLGKKLLSGYCFPFVD